MSTEATLQADAAGAGRGFLAGFTLRSVGVALALGALAAVLLNPIFVSPFVVLLARTLFVALALLLAYVAAGHGSARGGWRWLPRWAAQVLAVVLAAPPAALAAYLLTLGGDAAALFGNEHLLTGLTTIAVVAMVLGALLALGALVRERDAQAQALRLQVDLERSRNERAQVEAQLAQLRAQIEPHFLFNTLANVQALVESGSPRAAPVLASLIAYLRAAVPRWHDRGATLGDEAALARAYLELMQLRMPDRLQFAVNIAPALAGLAFPPMALLTLVENAVRHGIDPTEQGGRIEVGAAADAGGGWRAWVRDTGAGLAETAAEGTGLANLRARLAAQYGPGAELRLSEVPPHGLLAEIVVPAQDR